MIQVFFSCAQLCACIQVYFPLTPDSRTHTCACIDCLHQNFDISIIPIQNINVVINDYIPEIASLFVFLFLFCFLLYRVTALFQGNMAL